MARSSWLDDEKTERKYDFPDGRSWVVQNEYRPIKCPDCSAQQYCRLTHIWHLDVAGAVQPEYHINLDTDLEKLKRLLVTYVNDIGVSEVERDGRWVLLKGEELIAKETI